MDFSRLQGAVDSLSRGHGQLLAMFKRLAAKMEGDVRGLVENLALLQNAHNSLAARVEKLERAGALPRIKRAMPTPARVEAKPVAAEVLPPESEEEDA